MEKVDKTGRECLDGYIESFAVFSGERYAGSVIARLHYLRQREFSAAGVFRAEILGDRAFRQELRVTCEAGGTCAGEMRMELLFPKKRAGKRRDAGGNVRARTPADARESDADARGNVSGVWGNVAGVRENAVGVTGKAGDASFVALPSGATFWRKFSAEELRAFSVRTGDRNPIHLGEQPVVQGLLLFRELFFSLGEPQELHVVFHHAAHAGDGIYLLEERDLAGNEREIRACLGRHGSADIGHWRLCRAFSGQRRALFSAAFA